MDSQTLAMRCRDLADHRKGENIVVLDVRNISSITDFFVIVTGTSEPHLRAIVEEITEKLREENMLRAHGQDGSLATGWTVLDYFDVIIHVMRADIRERFNLEDLWGDAPQVRTRKKKTPAASPDSR